MGSVPDVSLRIASQLATASLSSAPTMILTVSDDVGMTLPTFAGRFGKGMSPRAGENSVHWNVVVAPDTYGAVVNARSVLFVNQCLASAKSADATDSTPGADPASLKLVFGP